jgi:hypothetical protein
MTKEFEGPLPEPKNLSTTCTGLVVASAQM